MQPHVRRVRAGDSVPFRTVRLRALEADPDAFGATYANSIDRPAAFWEDWVARASTGSTECIFVADADSSFVGLAGAFTPKDLPNTRHLIAMWVAPEHRRRGIGVQLTTAVIDWSAASSVQGLTLWVVEGNSGAQKLYEHAGFSDTTTSHPLPSNPSLVERLMSIEFAGGTR